MTALRDMSDVGLSVREVGIKMAWRDTPRWRRLRRRRLERKLAAVKAETARRR